jgi:hypothetical protein
MRNFCSGICRNFVFCQIPKSENQSYYIYQKYFKPRILLIQSGSPGPDAELKPPFTFHVDGHGDANDQHQNKRVEIAIFPAKLRHILEVHSINTCNKGEGNKNC